MTSTPVKKTAKRTPPPLPQTSSPGTASSVSGSSPTPVMGASRPPTRTPPPPPPAWKRERLGLQSIQNGSPQEESEHKTPVGELVEKHGLPETKYGAHSSSETTTEDVYDGNGALAGSETKRSSESSSGVLSKTEHQSTTAGTGGAVTTTKTESEALVGAQTKLETLARISDDELKVAVEMLARAGAFGKGAAEGSRRFGAASVSGKVEGEAGIGAQASLKAEAQVDRTGRLPQVSAAVEAAIKAGVWAGGSAQAIAKLGPVAFMIVAKIEAWAGAKAEFKAEAFANAKQGIGASVEAKAQAGAGAEASATGSLDLGPLGFDVSAEAAAFAGVEGKFAGGFRVSLTGIQAKFEASAFAGAKASVAGSAGLRIRGRKLVSIKGEIEVYAGVGAKAKGSFGMGGDWTKAGSGSSGSFKESELETSKLGDKDDKVKAPFEIDKSGNFKFGVALGAALGIGAGVELEAEADFAGIAEAILVGITELGRSDGQKTLDRMGPDFKREDLPADHPMAKRMYKKGYDAVFGSFQDYANNKALNGNNGVKRDKVQRVLDEINALVRPYFTYKETDKGMTQAAKDAFRGQVKDVAIEAGQIKTWVDEADGDVATFKGRMKEEEKWRKSRDELRNAFAEYAAKKESEGDHGVKPEKVQAIIAKHWSAIKTSFGAEAPELVKYAGQLARIDKYFVAGTFAVDNTGKLLPTAKIDAAATDTLKKDFQTGAAMQAMLGDLNNLESELKTYVEQAKAKKPFDRPGVEKILNKHVAKLKTDTPGLDALLAHIVQKALGETASTVTLENCRIKDLVLNTAKITTMQTDAETEKVKKSLVSSVAAYLEEKVGGSRNKNGVKKDRLNKIIKEKTADIAVARDKGDRDTDIKAWIEEALTPVQGTVTIVKGVATVDPAQPGFAEAKKRRAEDGKGSLKGGTELDNVRRSKVMDKLREPLDTYRQSHMRAVLATPGAKLNQVYLQGIIDKAMKSIAKDVRGAVGDQAVLQAIIDRFPMVDPAQTTVADLKLTLVQDDSWGQVLASDRKNGTGKGAAMAAITKDITDNGIKLRTTDTLQRVVDKHQMRLKADDRDAAIKQAIEDGFVGTATIETLVVAGGMVTKFKLKGK